MITPTPTPRNCSNCSYVYSLYTYFSYVYVSVNLCCFLVSPPNGKLSEPSLSKVVYVRTCQIKSRQFTGHYFKPYFLFRYSLLKLASSDMSWVLDSWSALVTKINTLSFNTFQRNMQPIENVNKMADKISSEDIYSYFLYKVSYMYKNCTHTYACVYKLCVCMCVCIRDATIYCHVVIY